MTLAGLQGTPVVVSPSAEAAVLVLNDAFATELYLLDPQRLPALLGGALLDSRG